MSIGLGGSVEFFGPSRLLRVERFAEECVKAACVPGPLGDCVRVEISKNPRTVIDFVIVPGRCRLDRGFQRIQNSHLRDSFNVRTGRKGVFSQLITETCIESSYISDIPRFHALNHQKNIRPRIPGDMRGIQLGPKMLCRRISGNSSIRVDQQRRNKVRSVFAHGTRIVSDCFLRGAARRDFHRLPGIYLGRFYIRRRVAH